MNSVKKHAKQIFLLGLAAVLVGSLLCSTAFAGDESGATSGGAVSSAGSTAAFGGSVSAAASSTAASSTAVTGGRDADPASTAPAPAPSADPALEQQLLQAALDAGLDPAEQEDGENSWRYRDGEVKQQAPVPQELQSSTFGAIAPGAAAFAANGTFGVDVSKFQGGIDWNAARGAGVNFAIIRCGYGLNLTSQDDPYWYANANGCAAAGIPFGVYIYSYATSAAHAQSEAEHVLRLVQGYNLSYPIYLDLEENRIAALGAGQIAEIANTFCTTIRNAGYSVGVYANKTWWNNYLTDPVFTNSGWSRWIAHWNNSLDYSGSGYNMWQFGGSYVDGIPGSVDSNYWYGASAPMAPTPTPRPAHTKTLEEGVYRFTSAGGTPLSAGGTDNVLWHVRYDSASKTYSFVDLSAGLALAYGSNGQFYTAKANGNYVQQFYIDSTASGYRIYPYWYDGDYALSFSGGALGLAARNDGAAEQAFGFANVSENVTTAADGAYRILCADGSGRALTVDNALLDSGVELTYTAAAADEPGQRFTVTGMDAGTYTLQSLPSNLYVSVEGDGKDEGTRLVQWSYTGKDGQKWFFLQKPNGNYNIVSAQSGMYLGKSSDGAVGIFTPNETAAQEFTLELLFAHTVADGIYTLAAADGSGLVLDVKGHTFTHGAEIQLAAPQTDDQSKWQKFRVTYIGSGLYAVACYASQFYSADGNDATQNVTAEDNANAEGARVIQWEPQDSLGQRWYFQQAGDGTYYMVSRCSGLYIGAPEVAADVSLQVWGKNNKNIMRFTLTTTAEEQGTAGQNAMVGDVSGDGVLDVEDLLYCAGFVCQRQTPTARQKLLADIDGDGEITVKDLARLSAYLSGKTRVL